MNAYTAVVQVFYKIQASGYWFWEANIIRATSTSSRLPFKEINNRGTPGGQQTVGGTVCRTTHVLRYCIKTLPHLKSYCTYHTMRHSGIPYHTIPYHTIP